MARARDFNGSANETIVVSPKDVKGKVKDSILGKKARLWLLTINNPQNHGIDDLCNCGKGYVSSVFTSYLTNFRRYLDIDDVGTDYVLNPTSGDWEQRYLLSPHIEPKKENDHDESEQQ